MTVKTVKRIVITCIIVISFWGTPVYADQVHRVSSGETLSGIARLHGITIDSILEHNQYIVNPNLIYPGQVVIIPDSNRQAYLVMPGDTLSRISQSSGVSISTLTDINNIDNPNILYAGQMLLIPEVHTVKEGESLAEISENIGVSLGDLMIENNLGSPDSIYPGQSLIIPLRPLRPTGREELSAVEAYLAPLAARFPDTFFYKGQPGGLRVALTFDDGPDQIETNAVLDILQRYRAPSTFFLLGRNMPGNSNVVERIVAEGHTVGNHSMTHPDLRQLTEEELQTEMLTMENEIYNITSLRTALMRPPYGFINDDNIRQLRDIGYKVIQWSVDSNDWRDMDLDQVLINTIPNVRDGSIILMHDYLPQSTTKEALPEIIHTLTSQGYSFVTVDELLGIDAYK